MTNFLERRDNFFLNIVMKTKHGWNIKSQKNKGKTWNNENSVRHNPRNLKPNPLQITSLDSVLGSQTHVCDGLAESWVNYVFCVVHRDIKIPYKMLSLIHIQMCIRDRSRTRTKGRDQASSENKGTWRKPRLAWAGARP